MEPKDQNLSLNLSDDGSSSTTGQSSDFSNRMQNLNKNSSKKNKKFIITTVVLTVVAVCGVGFGIYSSLQNSQKNSEKNNLETEILEKDEIIAKLQQDGSVSNEYLAATTGPYIEDNYFFVPEWGLKFNIPKDLTNFGYSVNYDEAQTGYTLPTIGFTATLKSDIAEGAQARYYDDIETCAIVSVSKEASWDNSKHINGLAKNFSGYTLLIWNYSRHDSCDYKLHIDEVQEKIQQMFSNPENI